MGSLFTSKGTTDGKSASTSDTDYTAKKNEDTSGTETGNTTDITHSVNTGTTDSSTTKDGTTTNLLAPRLSSYAGQVSDVFSPTNVANSGTGLRQSQLGAEATQSGLVGGLRPAFGAANQIATGGIDYASGIPKNMSPYISSVVNPTLQAYNTQNQQALQNIGGNAASRGALGNSNNAVEKALYYQGVAPQQEKAIADLYNTGYNNAAGLTKDSTTAQLSGAQTAGTLTNTASTANLGQADIGQKLWTDEAANKQKQYDLTQQGANTLGTLASNIGSQTSDTSKTTGTTSNITDTSKLGTSNKDTTSNTTGTTSGQSSTDTTGTSSGTKESTPSLWGQGTAVLGTLNKLLPSTSSSSSEDAAAGGRIGRSAGGGIAPYAAGGSAAMKPFEPNPHNPHGHMAEKVLHAIHAFKHGTVATKHFAAGGSAGGDFPGLSAAISSGEKAAHAAAAEAARVGGGGATQDQSSGKKDDDPKAIDFGPAASGLKSYLPSTQAASADNGGWSTTTQKSLFGFAEGGAPKLQPWQERSEDPWGPHSAEWLKAGPGEDGGTIETVETPRLSPAGGSGVGYVESGNRSGLGLSDLADGIKGGVQSILRPFSGEPARPAAPRESSGPTMRTKPQSESDRIGNVLLSVSDAIPAGSAAHYAGLNQDRYFKDMEAERAAATLLGQLNGVPTLEGRKAAHVDELFPLTKRQAVTATEAGEENLAATRQFRQDPYADNPPPTKGAARIPQNKYTPLDDTASSGTPNPDGVGVPGSIGETNKAVRGAVLPYAQTPDVASTNWKSLLDDPVHGFQRSGERPATAIEAARMFAAGTQGTGVRPSATATAPPVAPIAGAAMPASQPAPATPEAQGAATPSEGLPPLPAPLPSASPSISPRQQAALEALNRDRRRASNMISNGIPGGPELLKGIEEQVKTGQYLTPQGMVALPGHAENMANVHNTQEMGKKAIDEGAKRYEKIREEATAANELQSNINDFRNAQTLYQAYGKNPGAYGDKLLDLQKLAVRFGFAKEEATAPGELMRKIGMKLATGFASGTPGFSRITQSELQGFAKSVASIENTSKANDYILAAGERAIKLKNDIAKGAEAYLGMPGTPGYLDARFDAWAREVEERSGLRSVVQSFEREPEVRAAAAKEEAARTPAKADAPRMSRQDFLAQPDGIVDIPGSGRVIKRGELAIPVEGALGTRANPHANKVDVTKPGEHAFEGGKLFERTPNLFSDRWKEVQ